MSNPKMAEIATKLGKAGGLSEIKPDNARVLVRVMRSLAKGQPVTGQQVNEIVSQLEVDRSEAEEYLRNVTERDSQDNIVGIIGLSLNDDWVHRFQVNGVAMHTWCAWDTLFLPQILKQTATIESESPVTQQTVRVTAGPDGVKSASPADTVVSIVVLDPDSGQMSSVEQAWSNFCHRVYYFASREEAEGWAQGQNDVEVLTVDEAFELGRLVFKAVIQHA